MKWRNFSYRDSRTVIKKLSLEKTNAGSRDEVYWYYIDGKKQLRINMPNEHGGSGSISTGFIDSIMRNLKLKAELFERLVDCTLTAEKYEAMIREKLGLSASQDKTST